MNWKAVINAMLGSLFMLLVAACTKPDSIEMEESVILYVKGVNKNLFMQNYGIEFEMEHPGVKIMVLEYNDSGEQQPDLIYVGGLGNYAQMVNEGRLAPLDPYLNRDRNKLGFYLESSITAKGLEMFQSHTPEGLYALPLSLYSGALFFNKDLFDQYGVSYPMDFITWDEVIQLAQQFPAHTYEGLPLYGLSTTAYPGPFSYLNSYSSVRNLPYFDRKTWTITMNTPEWRTIWEAFLPGMKAGHYYMGSVDINNPIRSSENPFLLGQAAMIVETTMFIQELEKHNHNEKTINWDMVTTPILSREHPRSHSYGIIESYGIASDSPNKETAWDLLTDIVHKNPPVAEVAGKNLEPLYTLEFEYRSPEPLDDKTIPRLYLELQQIASEQLLAVIQDEKTLDEALQYLEQAGQHKLNEFRNKMETADFE